MTGYATTPTAPTVTTRPESQTGDDMTEQNNILHDYQGGHPNPELRAAYLRALNFAEETRSSKQRTRKTRSTKQTAATTSA